jgi:hypothetical protein
VCLLCSIKMITLRTKFMLSSARFGCADFPVPVGALKN